MHFTDELYGREIKTSRCCTLNLKESHSHRPNKTREECILLLPGFYGEWLMFSVVYCLVLSYLA